MSQHATERAAAGGVTHSQGDSSEYVPITLGALERGISRERLLRQVLMRQVDGWKGVDGRWYVRRVAAAGGK